MRRIQNPDPSKTTKSRPPAHFRSGSSETSTRHGRVPCPPSESPRHVQNQRSLSPLAIPFLLQAYRCLFLHFDRGRRRLGTQVDPCLFGNRQHIHHFLHAGPRSVDQKEQADRRELRLSHLANRSSIEYLPQNAALPLRLLVGCPLICMLQSFRCRRSRSKPYRDYAHLGGGTFDIDTTIRPSHPNGSRRHTRWPDLRFAIVVTA